MVFKQQPPGTRSQALLYLNIHINKTRICSCSGQIRKWNFQRSPAGTSLCKILILKACQFVNTIIAARLQIHLAIRKARSHLRSKMASLPIGLRRKLWINNSCSKPQCSLWPSRITIYPAWTSPKESAKPKAKSADHKADETAEGHCPNHSRNHLRWVPPIQSK